MNMASDLSTPSVITLSDMNLPPDTDMDKSTPSTTSDFSALPTEILQRILHFSTTPTFLQLILVNRQLFGVAAESREVLLHHLQNLPGLKLGLRDHCVATADLFLILRQRAANNLYGTNFTADCSSFAFSNNVSLLSQSSSLAVGTDGCPELSMVVKDDASIRLYTHRGSYRETIESPYADGKAKIVQVVQHYATISVLYAWTPPEEDLASKVEDHEPAIKGSSRHYLTITKDPPFHRPPTLSIENQNQLPKAVQSVRYHLMHYNMYTNERPIFYHIPTHRSLRNTILTPVHLAVHSRVLCAIVWDEQGSLRPTSRVSVVLYNAERLPRRGEGIYSAFVVYPFDHPAPPHSTGVKSTLSNDQDHGIGDHDDQGGEQLWTRTNPKESKHDRDLRLVDLHFKPRATAFFKDGRRLALYAPGSSVPYMTVLSNRVLRQQMVPSFLNMVPLRPNVTERLDMRHHRLCRGVSSTNVTSVYGLRFQLSMPFFSRHDSMFLREGDDYCVTHDLCIGSAKIPDSLIFSRGQLELDMAGPPVLTIVQIRRRKPFDACMHVETKDDLPPLPPPPRPRPPRIAPVETEEPNINTQAAPTDDDDIDHLASAPTYTQDLEQNIEIHEETEFFERSLVAAELRVVARLWGWAPQTTTLTGLDTVSVSPNGQRIAIAQWDRVLLYALDPVALCERPFDFDLDAPDSNDGSSSAAVTDWGTTSDSGSESGDDADANANQGLGAHVNPVSTAAAASSNTDNTTPLTNTSAVNNDPSNNSPTNDGADENENNPQSEQPALDSGETASPPSPTQGPPPAEPISPAVPEPPTTAVPQPAPSSPKSAGSTSRASSQSTTASARLLKFYPNTHDGFLGRRVVELRPIVLKMEHGAVVRKMVWSENSSDGGGDGEVEEENDAETKNANENENENGKDTEEAGQANTEESKEEATAIDDSSSQTEITDSGMDSNPVSVRHPVEEPSATSGATASRATRKSIPSTSSADTATIQEEGLSSGLTPQSRLQIVDSELKHQIRFVKRPPEYTMALNNDIIDINFDMDTTNDTAGNTDAHAGSVAGSTQNDADDAKTERDDKPRDDAISDSEQKDKDDDDTDKGKSSDRPASPSHTVSSTQHPASGASSTTERPRPRPKRRKKAMENELVVLTDRDVQVWDLGVWGTGKRVESELKFQSVDSCLW